MAEMTTEMTEMAEMAEMDGDDEWMDARRGAEGGKGRHWMVRRVERVRMCGELWMCGVALVCDVFRRMEGGCGLCVACARCELVILWTVERVSHSVVRRERVSSTLEGVCALVATCRFSDPTHVCVRCAYISILLFHASLRKPKTDSAHPLWRTRPMARAEADPAVRRCICPRHCELITQPRRGAPGGASWQAAASRAPPTVTRGTAGGASACSAHAGASRSLVVARVLGLSCTAWQGLRCRRASPFAVPCLARRQACGSRSAQRRTCHVSPRGEATSARGGEDRRRT